MPTFRIIWVWSLDGRTDWCGKEHPESGQHILVPAQIDNSGHGRGKWFTFCSHGLSSAQSWHILLLLLIPSRISNIISWIPRSRGSRTSQILSSRIGLPRCPASRIKHLLGSQSLNCYYFNISWYNKFFTHICMFILLVLCLVRTLIQVSFTGLDSGLFCPLTPFHRTSDVTLTQWT